MKLSLVELLDKENIKWWDSGKNVGDDYINITCPFCDDSSNHCGINKQRYFFKCLRCSKGGSLKYLSQGLFKKGKPYINFEVYQIDINNVPIKKKYLSYTDFLDKGAYEGDVIASGLAEIRGGKERFKGRNICFYIGAYYLPLLNGTVSFNVFSSRYYTNGTGWYGEREVNLAGNSKLFVCEGIFDCLCFDAGLAIALLGKNFNNNSVDRIIKNKSIKQVNFCFDSDVPYDNYKKFFNSLRILGLEVKIFDWNKFYSFNCDKKTAIKVKDIDDLYLWLSKDKLEKTFLSYIENFILPYFV